jgi:arsenate reductase
MKQKVLFLCTHNSARSQMAEGLLRALAGERFEAYSAGTEATLVRPLAIEVMKEIGIDISGQTSKTLDRYLSEPFACPHFPNAKRRLHWSLPDPSRATGSDEEQRNLYRLVRDRLRQHIEEELLNAV